MDFLVHFWAFFRPYLSSYLAFYSAYKSEPYFPLPGLPECTGFRGFARFLKISPGFSPVFDFPRFSPGF